MLHWFTTCTKLFYWTICIHTYLFIDWILHLVKKSLLFYKTLKHWYNFWIGNAYSKMHLGWSYPAPYIILWYVGYNSNLQSSKTHQKYSGKIIVNLNSIRCLRVWLDSCSFILWTCSMCTLLLLLNTQCYCLLQTTLIVIQIYLSQLKKVGRFNRPKKHQDKSFFHFFHLFDLVMDHQYPKPRFWKFCHQKIDWKH